MRACAIRQIAYGLAECPASPISLHILKNFSGSPSCARSALRVMLIPEPIPFVSPISMHTARNGKKLVARGINKKPIDIPAVHTSAENLLPKWSMAIPEGMNITMSMAELQMKIGHRAGALKLIEQLKNLPWSEHYDPNMQARLESMREAAQKIEGRQPEKENP